jgi:hypothetical protein
MWKNPGARKYVNSVVPRSSVDFHVQRYRQTYAIRSDTLPDWKKLVDRCLFRGKLVDRCLFQESLSCLVLPSVWLIHSQVIVCKRKIRKLRPVIKIGLLPRQSRKLGRISTKIDSAISTRTKLDSPKDLETSEASPSIKSKRHLLQFEGTDVGDSRTVDALGCLNQTACVLRLQDFVGNFLI